MLSSGSRDAEARRAVVLVAHLPHDPGAGGHRPRVDAVGVVGDDVHRRAAGRQLRELAVVAVGGADHHAAALGPHELGVDDDVVGLARHDELGDEAERLGGEGDGGAGVAVVEAGPHASVGSWSDHAPSPSASAWTIGSRSSAIHCVGLEPASVRQSRAMWA